jgi:hypothetical protein
MIFITGEKIMVSSIKKLKAIALSFAFIISIPISFSSAEDLELPGFSGTINTTLTSGLSFRASERDCALQDGYSYNLSTANLSAQGQGALGLRKLANPTLTDADILSGGAKNYQFSNSCASLRVDGYGNTSTNVIEYGNVNGDDGNLNYDNGDIIDATTKASVKISGYTDTGLGVNVSFIGSYNPVNDLSSPGFKQMNQDAESALESDFTLLDAYVTGEFDAGGSIGYVDVTAGRFVTSWGEATFIPVGVNGLVTNALDLTKLRAPGASIRDALVPTEQISLSFNAGDVGFEIYTQLQSSEVELDPAGSFFGNEITGAGGNLLLANGAYTNESGLLGGCGYMATAAPAALGGLEAACNAETQALVRANPATHSVLGQAQVGFRAANAAQWNAWTTVGANVDHGTTFNSRLTGTPFEGLSFTNVTNTMADYTTDSSDAAKMADLVTLWNSTLRATTNDQAATVELKAATNKYVEARNDGQFGIRANAYLDNIGTGVDLGFYYANYHSKVPYAQITGMGGLLAGDIVGAYATQIGDALGSGDGSPGFDATDLANVSIFNSGQIGTYGSGICGGLGALLGHDALNNDMPSQFSKQVYQSLMHQKLVNGEMVHDASTCMANDNGGLATNPYTNATVGLLMTLTPVLAGAVLPLNYAQYGFIYPEDIEVFGASFNTNVGPTTVQGEIALRPDMPLATSAGDQINQIGDASGVTLALTAFGHDTYALAAAATPWGVLVPGHVNTLNAAGVISKDFATLLKEAKRSSLPRIAADRVGTVGTNYKSDAFIRYDVVSVDIGTTTSFSASHPITEGIGADGSVLLTELAMVQINNMNDRANGFVARGGFNEGAGEHMCLGIYDGLPAAERAALNASVTANLGALGVGTTQNDHNFDGAEGASNLGASIVDAIFGNGSYCESNSGADSTSFSYRLVGSATYNNVNNTAWSLVPSVVWSHDPSGYGPSSLGGFTEGRQSLSLGLTARKGEGLSTSLNYVNQMGERTSNLRSDMDYLSASVTYAF